MLSGYLTKRCFLPSWLFLVLAVSQLAPLSGAAGHVQAATRSIVSSPTGATGGAAGNRGTIKIAESPALDEPPAGGSNEPHVTCPFWIQGYKFPVGSGTLSVSVQAPAVAPQTVGQVIITNLPWSGTQQGPPQSGGFFFNMPDNSTGFGWADGFVAGGHYEVDVTDARNDKNKVFFTAACAAPSTATPTSTPIAPATQTAYPAPPTATATATGYPAPPTATATPIGHRTRPTATATPTRHRTRPTSTPQPNVVAPSPTPDIRYVTLPTPSPVTVVQPAPSPVTVVQDVPAPTDTPAPTSTPSNQVASTTVVTKTRYRTVTKIRYRTVTRTQYREIIRTTTRVKVRYVVKTVLRYRTVTRVKHVTRMRTVVHHTLRYQTRVRYVTVVRYRTRVVLRHKTVVRVLTQYHYLQHPKTGRFAAPVARWQGALPAVEARLSIARLGIHGAPVWARDFLANADGSLRYDLVPFYGATRFSPSARFGQAGLTLLSGHDDIAGSIFRYLNTLRRGDVIQVRDGTHTYRYVVSAVQTVAPDDVRLLNAPRVRPTLALVSCTPYWVDTQRVVVIAQMR